MMQKLWRRETGRPPAAQFAPWPVSRWSWWQPTAAAGRLAGPDGAPWNPGSSASWRS